MCKFCIYDISKLSLSSLLNRSEVSLGFKFKVASAPLLIFLFVLKPT